MKFFLTVVILCLAIIANGQTPFFKHQRLTNKNEKHEIKRLFQDSNGFIWIATDNGLFQYNGFSFSYFTIQDGLADNRISAIAQDSTGRIWVGHSNGQLSFLDGSKFKTFVTQEGAATQEVSDVIFDKKGVLWFSTLNEGIYYYTNSRLYQLAEEEGMPDMYVYDLEESPDGKIWAGTDRGIAICELKDKVTIQLINQKLGLPDNIVRKIKFSNKQTVWLGTQDLGVIKFEIQQNKFTAISKSWAYGSISDLTIKQNQVWMGCTQRELLMIEDNSEVKKFILPNSVNALMLDSEGGIWAGGKNGLTRTSGTEFSFIDLPDLNSKQSIVALTKDVDENIWFSNSEGLFKMTMLSGKYRTSKVNGSFQNPPVISLHTDSKGNIWAGTFGNGVYQLNSTGSVIHHFKNELRNGNILSIASTDDQVWLATLEGVTQLVSTNSGYQIKNIGSKEGLSSDYIYQVFLDSKKRAWFATDGKDVDMWDTEGIHHFTVGESQKVVYGLAEDGDHTIWANVQGEGLYHLERNKFQHLQKLRNQNVHSLTTNAFGELVVVHDLGVEIIDFKKDFSQFFETEAESNAKRGLLNSIAQGNGREILVGTEHGILYYEPLLALQTIKPKPFVQQLIAGDQIFSKAKDLTLSHNNNDVKFSYLGIWYNNPQNLHFQYRLENFDKNWIGSKDLEVTYSRLPPGKYIFHVRTSDTEDFTNQAEDKFSFQITPPFWQRAWFYGVLITTAIVLFISFIKIRERGLQRDRQRLKLKVDERTRELQMRNEEIQAQSEELQAQSAEIKKINDHLEDLVKMRTAELEKKNIALEEYAFINAHKLRSPLASILGLVNLMKILPHTTESKECADRLTESAKSLDEVVSSITRVIENADKK